MIATDEATGTVASGSAMVGATADDRMTTAEAVAAAVEEEAATTTMSLLALALTVVEAPLDPRHHHHPCRLPPSPLVLQTGTETERAIQT